MLLAVSAAVTIAMSVLFTLAERCTRFGRWKYALRQLVIGAAFGLCACLATEIGLDLDGATLNVRDAAPLCAGLIFGWPAGVLAGIIGGVERWFAALWGAGEATRLACALATVIAGVFGAGLRKFLFDDKQPSWVFGLAIGMTTEVLHMLLLFITKMGDIYAAFAFVRACALPMTAANACTVAAAMLITAALSGRNPFRKSGARDLAPAFQRWLLICVSIAFLATNFFTGFLQTELSRSDAESLLAFNLQDVQADISDASDEHLLQITKAVRRRVDSSAEITDMLLDRVAVEYDVSFVNIIDADGIIVHSNDASLIGYDMADGAQSAEFLALLDEDVKTYVQDYQPTSLQREVWAKYAGMRLRKGGFVQVGYNDVRFQQDIANQLANAVRNRRIGKGGGICIVDQQGSIVGSSAQIDVQDWIGDRLSAMHAAPGEAFIADFGAERYLCMLQTAEGYRIIALLPEREALYTRDLAVYVSVFMEVLVFAALFIHIYMLIKRLVVDNLRKVNAALEQITGGNLNTRVEVRSHREFASLSDDINQTVATLKRYIAEAAARIDRELEFAHAIQTAALPSVFPPYPARRDLDIYAQMDAAKEVGGDFYDFYFVGEDQLAFVIADVSGKGIPAAMFMMTAKTTIKDLAESGLSVDEVLTRANERLCQNNEAGMFVTAWMGILNLKTGLLHFANAGHNPPLVRRDGQFAFFKARASLVLAGMEGVCYRAGEIQLAPGDAIFLYTDGVTEAADHAQMLYGDARLERIINACGGESMQGLCQRVRADVDAFVGDAPQFDDITMLAIEYRGGAQDAGNHR